MQFKSHSIEHFMIMKQGLLSDDMFLKPHIRFTNGFNTFNYIFNTVRTSYNNNKKIHCLKYYLEANKWDFYPIIYFNLTRNLTYIAIVLAK